MSVRITDRVVLPLWNSHVRTWQGCKRCPIGKHAFRHVFARGDLPCEVLFVGEAPGKSEDSVGEPFVGKAGRLLDHWIAESKLKRSYAVTNIIACRPCDSSMSDNRKPTTQEIENCTPRLFEFVRDIAKPQAVVLLGQTTKNSFPGNWPEIPTLEIWHPAYVLRLGGAGTKEDKIVIDLLCSFFRSVSFKEIS